MRDLRKFATIAVIAAMSVLLSPRNWFHDCHHGDHAAGESVTIGDCQLCEQTVQPAVANASYVVAAFNLTWEILVAPKTSDLALGFILLAADRGPPVG